MNLLALQKIARPGDGLAPVLLRILSACEALAADAKIVPLRRFNSAIPEIADARTERTATAEQRRPAAADGRPRRGTPPT